MAKKTVIEALKKSPMFQLSLSSKELFHSNFLYWIWNISPALFKDIINELLGHNSSKTWPDKYSVKREYNNYDLCVVDSIDTVKLVIENKVKSIPNLKQLKAYKNYEDGKKNNDVEYLLLSLTDDFPEKQEITKEWSFANYRRLSEVIRELISGKYSSKLDAYQKSIFRDYCTFIDCLHQIQSEWRINEFTPYRIESDDYKELRINDLKEKIRFSKMCVMLGAIIEQELKKTVDYNTERAHIFGENNKDNIGQIFINSGMTRSQGLLEIKILVKSAVALVIQIQGNQYRHCIEFALSKSYKDDKKNWEKYSVDQSTGWYIRSHIDKNQAPFIAFKNSKLPLEIRPCPSRKGKGDGYNKYGNEFLYQSIIIPEGTLVGEIFNMVIYDCKRIFEHIS